MAATDGPGPRRIDVVGLGYCTYDILAIVPRLPEFDDVRMVHLDELVYDGGGQVGTALATIARLGGSAGYVGVLGDDLEGRWLRDLCARQGVDVSRLRLERGVGTNRCVILIHQDTAGRAILCQPRVRPADLVLGEVDRAYIQAARVLHLDGQFLPAAVQAATWARQAGVKVCFDGNHPRPGLDELLPLVDWLVVAEAFALEQTGRPTLDQAASHLLAAGTPLLVVTQGERGSQAWAAGDRWHIPAFPVRAVDTTGAGDAYHGGLIYGLLQGWDVPRAAIWASAVAALNCRCLGGRRGLPTTAEVHAILGVGALQG